MALGFSKLHQQVPLTKFLGTTKDMKRNKVVIKTIFARNTLNHRSFLGS